jgi:hypothetical protein
MANERDPRRQLTAGAATSQVVGLFTATPGTPTDCALAKRFSQVSLARLVATGLFAKLIILILSIALRNALSSGGASHVLPPIPPERQRAQQRWALCLLGHRDR